VSGEKQGNELCKGRMLSGERKISSRIIEFVRGRERALVL